MKKNMKKVVVPDVTPTSSFLVLTRFLISSVQESDRKKVMDILEKREQRLKEIFEKELNEEKSKVEKLINEGNLKQKKLEAEVKNLREEHEKELMNKKKELEDEMRKQSDMYEKSLEFEVERLGNCHKMKELEAKEIYEVLKRERDSMENKLSLASMEKYELECVMIKRSDVYEKSLKVELGRNCDLEAKLSRASLEKSRLEEELRKARNLEEELMKSRMYLEEKVRVLEGKNLDLNKEIELHKVNVCEMKGLAEHIIGVHDSTISGNVRTNGPLNNGSNAGDVSMFLSREKASDVEGHLIESQISSGEPPSKSPLQAESEGQRGKPVEILLEEKSGGDNENNLKQNLKRRRSTRQLLTNEEIGKLSMSVLSWRGKQLE